MRRVGNLALDEEFAPQFGGQCVDVYVACARVGGVLPFGSSHPIVLLRYRNFVSVVAVIEVCRRHCPMSATDAFCLVSSAVGAGGCCVVVGDS